MGSWGAGPRPRRLGCRGNPPRRSMRRCPGHALDRSACRLELSYRTHVLMSRGCSYWPSVSCRLRRTECGLRQRERRDAPSRTDSGELVIPPRGNGGADGGRGHRRDGSRRQGDEAQYVDLAKDVSHSVGGIAGGGQHRVGVYGSKCAGSVDLGEAAVDSVEGAGVGDGDDSLTRGVGQDYGVGDELRLGADRPGGEDGRRRDVGANAGLGKA